MHPTIETNAPAAWSSAGAHLGREKMGNVIVRDLKGDPASGPTRKTAPAGVPLERLGMREKS